ncbi:MAG: 54S ribosomal protein L9, mitochondrial [Alyxoria varia]|nr:MAG: 54S ribosomal protein L9, mitochondrial [Alyxoria varia]
MIGQGTRKPKNVGQAMLGVYANAKHVNASGHVVGVNPKRDVREFKVRDQSGLLGIGQMVTANWFQEGQFVDAKSKTKGKGFTGVMKRWGMAGQPASHGASLSHRSMGSSGGGQGSGSRVHPGKKMAGRMGGEQHTVQNLKVMKVDDENGMIVVHGCVSGPNGALVKVQDAVKKSWPER